MCVEGQVCVWGAEACFLVLCPIHTTLVYVTLELSTTSSQPGQPSPPPLSLSLRRPLLQSYDPKIEVKMRKKAYTKFLLFLLPINK